MILSPLPIQKFFDSNGEPMVGGKLFTYIAGTTTKVATYTSSTGLSTNTNPIILDYRGECSVWLDPELTYKFVLAPSNDTDPPTRPIWTVDQISALGGLTQQIIGKIIWPRTAAEIAVGVTPATYAYPPYDLRRYGGVGDNVTNNVTAISSWTAAADAAGSEGLIPDGLYRIGSTATLPKKVSCYGSITGAFIVLYAQRQYGYVNGMTCEQFKLSGAYNCSVENLRASTSIIVDGFDNTWGVFWCDFKNWDTPSLTVTISKFSVNENTWYGGLLRYLHITGDNATYAFAECHNNTWDNCDFSNNSLPNFGVLQDDTKGQVNYLRSCYFENGSQIVGNFHILGMNGDASQPPLTSRFKHILFSDDHIEKNCKDFLSLQVHNLARGGQWDWLDSAGKPPCLTNSGGTAVSVAVDATEPNGIGKAYQATFNAAFGNFQFTVQPNNTDRVAAVVFYKSTSNFLAVEVSDGSTTTSCGIVSTVVDAGNNWKMLKISAHANKTGLTTITLFAQLTPAVGSPTFSIGAIFAGQEKAIVFPNRNDEFYSLEGANNSFVEAVGQAKVQSGSVDQATIGVSPVNVAITFPEAFAVTPNLVHDFLKTGGTPNTQNLTKSYLTALSTTGATVTVEFAGNWDGRIYWLAQGRR